MQHRNPPPSIDAPHREAEAIELTQPRARRRPHMSYSRHATAPDQSRAPTRGPSARRPTYCSPAGYQAIRLSAPGAAIVHAVEQFDDGFPANRAQRPPRDWISLLDDEQVGDDVASPAASDAVKMVRRASICRCGDAACNLHKMEKALRGTFLDICSSNESTIHPANCLLIQAQQDLVRSACHTNEHYSQLLVCWASELEKDAEMVCQGEKGRKYMFLLNNTVIVLQTMTRLGASFSNVELLSTLTSMIKTSYLEECWVPLKNALVHLNLDRFTAEFLETCGNQRAWKVTAVLRYKLREEILDLIAPSYQVSLSALQANRSRFPELLCFFTQVIAGKKKQRKHTREELEEEIMALFEG